MNVIEEQADDEADGDEQGHGNEVDDQLASLKIPND